MSERVIHRLCKFLGGVLAQIAAIALGAAVSVQAQELVALDGELAIQFWVNTRPGGETIRAGNSIMSPYHLAYFAAAPRSVVGADGTFAIAVLGAQDHYRDDHLQNDIGGPGKHHIVLSCRPVLRGKGQLKRDGTLVVELEWIRGEGRYASLSNTAGAAVFALPASETGLSSRWELTPHSVQREETAHEIVREVRTYVSTRQADVPYVQPLTTTERIEIKHTRSLNLVPRG
jgi:hypothetical protein